MPGVRGIRCVSASGAVHKYRAIGLAQTLGLRFRTTGQHAHLKGVRQPRESVAYPLDTVQADTWTRRGQFAVVRYADNSPRRERIFGACLLI